ncbi:ATP-binding protein [Desulforamulus ruminis]|uniref:AAA+ ATPase domain-containing protein n=1 Tax=Desulforamulus ruminis (strain ATCC 23193 / DSM 2154 / NCIMB 8452 / DL) TaxID=696281 RepID=F6DUK8_DESRL|nr:ATP-binding protein [Desulforamulus ruminis]AEG59075.1 protein of unknown function DUF815 [Desulforamulus ruminis DSM 2154]
MNRNDISPLYQSLHCLTLFQDIQENQAIKIFAGITGAAAENGFLPEEKLADYHRMGKVLLEAFSSKLSPPAGNPWQNHLLNLILLDDNPFTRAAAEGSPISPALREACLHDLRILQTLCEQGLEILDEIFQVCPGYFKMNGFISSPASGDLSVTSSAGRLLEMKQRLLQSDHWPGLLDDLLSFYPRVGLGDFALYWAFHWEETPSGYRLSGIEKPDPIRFQQLIGYQRQRQQVIDNTERLLEGLTAHHLLLYGDRGTGKSSTVKALLHEYGPSGLRLVQVSKKNLGSLQQLTRYLRKIPLKFIIFIDDLSFEEKETEYKEFKTQMEGSLEQQPSNLRIYVTSNQRNLIKEYFTDRKLETTRGGEVHPGDTAQEKLSLADRFGLKVTFQSPDKMAFLNIVRELARQEEIMLDSETLEKLALQWILWHNERSGRTARQFIDHLKYRDNIDF